MYKWPQGRIIRTISLLLAIAIAVDLGVDAYYKLTQYFNPTGSDPVPWQTLAVGIFAGVLSAAMLIGGLIAIGFHAKSVDFLIEVEQEMVRVTWPTSRTLIQSTIWIAVMTAVLTTLIFGVDIVIVTYVINPLTGK